MGEASAEFVDWRELSSTPVVLMEYVCVVAKSIFAQILDQDLRRWLVAPIRIRRRSGIQTTARTRIQPASGTGVEAASWTCVEAPSRTGVQTTPGACAKAPMRTGVRPTSRPRVQTPTRTGVKAAAGARVSISWPRICHERDTSHDHRHFRDSPFWGDAS